MGTDWETGYVDEWVLEFVKVEEDKYYNVVCHYFKEDDERNYPYKMPVCVCSKSILIPTIDNPHPFLDYRCLIITPRHCHDAYQDRIGIMTLYDIWFT
jgi:hypothetical protein